MNPHLSDDVWALVQSAVPVVCVDIVPVRRTDIGVEVGLIRRLFADDGRPVWCHLGGRVRHGETTDEAVARHVAETLVGAHVSLGEDPQPHHVMQWFPPALKHGPTYGDDPRKHAVSLCWAIDLGHDLAVRPGGEGSALRWLAPDLSDILDEDLWPGTRHLVMSTLSGARLI